LERCCIWRRLGWFNILFSCWYVEYDK
jgi:hypothetical protein